MSAATPKDKDKTMKKIYSKPTMKVVRIQQTHIICASVTGTDGNAGLNYGGGGSGPANARQRGGFDWDDDWSE